MNSSPRLAAVVLNWRDPEATVACVESLLGEKEIASIIVVDNESSGELRPIECDSVTLIESPENLGFARGVNLGIRHALEHGADAVLMINNDATMRPGSVSTLFNTWRRAGRNVAMLAPKVLYPDGTQQSTGGRFRAFDASTRDLGTENINYLTWACVLVPRETFDEIGLLDEGFFMYWEDVDFGLRLTDRGKQMLMVDEAVVFHSKSKSHGRAGAKIDRYSAHGLVLLCLKRGGVAKWAGMPYRIARRLLGRFFNSHRFRAVIRGAKDGVTVHRSRTASPAAQSTGARPAHAEPSAQTPRSARYYRSARTAHLERLHEQRAGDFFYQKEMYDFDLKRAPDGARVTKVRLRHVLAAVWRKTYGVLEVVEPYAPSALPQSLAICAVSRLSRLTPGEPTILVAYAIENADLPQKFATRFRVPVAVTEAAFRWSVGYCYSTFSRIAFGTTDAQINYESLLERRFNAATQPATRTIEGLSAPRRNLLVPVNQETPTLVFLGALDARKGITNLLKAWPLVHRELPQARFRIIGKGELSQFVSAEAETMTNVEICLDPPREEIWRLLAEGTALGLMSQPWHDWKEQIGLPIIEALSVGLEVIASNETGISQWLRDNGHRVVPHDAPPAALAAQLIGALSMPRDRYEILAPLPTRDGRTVADEWLHEDRR